MTHTTANIASFSASSSSFSLFSGAGMGRWGDSFACKLDEHWVLNRKKLCRDVQGPSDCEKCTFFIVLVQQQRNGLTDLLRDFLGHFDLTRWNA